MESVLSKTGKINGIRIKSDIILYLLFDFFISIVLCLILNTTSIFFVNLISAFLFSVTCKGTSSIHIKYIITAKILVLTYALIQYFSYIDMYGTPYYIGGSDDKLFENLAKYMVEENLYWPWECPDGDNFSGFVVILAFLIRFIEIFSEYHPFDFIIINLNLWIIMSVIVVEILQEGFYHNNVLFNSKEQNLIFFVMGIFPNAVYITSHIFRDTVCSFILLLVYRWALTINNKKDTKAKLHVIIRIVISALIMHWIRRECAFFIGAILILSFVKKNTSRNRKIIYIVSISVLFLYFAYITGILEYAVDKFGRYVKYNAATGNTIINKIYTIPLIPLGALIRALYGLLSPLPNGLFRIGYMFTDYYAFRDVLISIGSLAQIVFLPFLFRRLRKMDLAVLTFLITYLGNRLVTSTFRHIIMAYPFMILLMCLEYKECAIITRKRALFFSGFLVFAMGMIYIVLFGARYE